MQSNGLPVSSLSVPEPTGQEPGFEPNRYNLPTPTERPHLSSFMIQKRSAPKRSNRPSTAPSSEGKLLLPSMPSRRFDSTWLSPCTTPESELPRSQTKPAVASSTTSLYNDCDDGRFDAESSTHAVDIPSSMNDTSSSLGDDRTLVTNVNGYDWRTFIAAYAAGRWDPHKTPNPPSMSSQTSSSENFFSQKSTPPDSEGNQRTQSAESSNPSSDSSGDPRSPALLPLGPPNPRPSSIKARTPIPLHLPLPAHRLRNSFSASLSHHTPTNPSSPSSFPHSVSNPDVHTTVATMRWAAARVDISPLALPSPEHELTDPMRGIMTTVPGAHSRDLSVGSDFLLTPGGTRRLRLSSFWAGTTDVEGTRLATIEGSPSESTVQPTDADPSNLSASGIIDDESQISNGPRVPRTGPSLVVPFPPPASAPVPNHTDSKVAPLTDYFGNARPPTRTASSTSSEDNPSQTASAPVPHIYSADDQLTNGQTLSVPATSSRRISLTRQSSSPLPVSVPQDKRGTRIMGGRVACAGDSISGKRSSRMSKFEHNFYQSGYLIAPYPPDEIDRRRALYKFNIWHTGPDPNFDRIAHLVKLVFNTRGVFISLLDDREQWFKAEWGWKSTPMSREQSICGHAILQRCDEPLVVLDTHNDWRFSSNPHGAGNPPVRFYAGAPLRTQDGYNIGTLSIIDDQPRDEFSPRQRHTLKEFAAITMREMELWRDKIQLRMRDRIQLSMEQFSRECLEIDSGVHEQEGPDIKLGTSMDRVYDRAAKLVERTLDVEGVVVMDVSHCEVMDSVTSEGGVSVTLHHGEPESELVKKQLSMEECRNLLAFFDKYPDGRMSEGIVPQSLKPFLPTHVHYALTVPIFNIDKRPFALLCAFNTTSNATQSLDGHELSYLRAIGVIILSAVLKRRMILADKAKGLFISNISHELRTPLHGILAAAELLGETALSPLQDSFLQTVQACGSSLVETVNHVLDFTKLSGTGKAGGVEHAISPAPVDLLQLVEDAVDGCWIGYRARTAAMGDGSIGSVYSPPRDDQGSPIVSTRMQHVETVIDVGYRPHGWTVKCERGGIRRVLMNLFGNSLKFTTDGYVHVSLRQLLQADDDPPDKVKIELGVLDTGKGISQNFLKNQLFHPFSQENPLQPGTGLGLAIVSSIITSEAVNGKVDVWSEEGVGTEIRVTFTAELVKDGGSTDLQPFSEADSNSLPAIGLIGFLEQHPGTQLLRNTLLTYLTSWWGFQVADAGDVVILNEDASSIVHATETRDISRPFIILSSARGNPSLISISSEHELIGGFCRILYKPCCPSRLRALLRLSIHALTIAKSNSHHPPSSFAGRGDLSNHGHALEKHREHLAGGIVPRRNSEETQSRRPYGRPRLSPRSSTAHTLPQHQFRNAPVAKSTSLMDEPDPDTPVPTITIGSGGTLLKASIGTLDPRPRFRVLVVEDNSILRNLLIKWLTTKGYDFRAAVDGRDGVTVFEKEGPFDVILLDLSMPKLDGVGATSEIRRLEETTSSVQGATKVRILALTGMSSLEDKRKAFEAGVDGYLVKPVAFKTLDEIFQKLGTGNHAS